MMRATTGPQGAIDYPASKVEGAEIKSSTERKSRFRSIKKVFNKKTSETRQYSDEEHTEQSSTPRDQADTSGDDDQQEGLLFNFTCFDCSDGNADADGGGDATTSEMIASDDMADYVLKTLDAVTDGAERMGPEMKRVVEENVAYVNRQLATTGDEDEAEIQSDAFEVRKISDKEEVVEETTSSRDPVLLESAIQDINSIYMEGVTEATRIYETQAPVVAYICSTQLSKLEQSVQKSITSVQEIEKADAGIEDESFGS
mmetsp:Transcript_38306/g.84106  ORF Transcript_38306/g.84106 Transcript_38306/m.84106 type:complete len:258 (+) Transcript_38306:77-850(+)